MAVNPELLERCGRFGVWTFGSIRPEQAEDIERLGYGMFWAGGSPDAALEFVEPLLAQTKSLVVATGVANIWTAPAKDIAQSYHRIDRSFPGRFMLGVGVGHPEMAKQYQSPYAALVRYLDELDAAGVPKERRIMAALGPRVLAMAEKRSCGAHPYLTTAKHTATAREVLGTRAFLAPEHKVVLTNDPARARVVGRKGVGPYMPLANYRSSWRRLGFAERDFDRPGSDEFIDALVAHGDAATCAEQLSGHIEAGADHVAIQVLGGWDALLPTLADLAPALGLTPRR